MHVEARFDLATHCLRPRLGPVNADAQRGASRVDALAVELVGDRQGVRRSDNDDMGTQVDDEANLLFRLTARHRDDGAAESLRAIVRAKSAREEAVAVRDVDAISLAHAR